MYLCVWHARIYTYDFCVLQMFQQHFVTKLTRPPESSQQTLLFGQVPIWQEVGKYWPSLINSWYQQLASNCNILLLRWDYSITPFFCSVIVWEFYFNKAIMLSELNLILQKSLIMKSTAHEQLLSVENKPEAYHHGYRIANTFYYISSLYILFESGHTLM